MIIAWMLLCATAAPAADTVVVARTFAASERTALVAACAAQYQCRGGDDVADALADAKSLGIDCRDDDATCWQRFLAAEGFARIVVGEHVGSGARVTVIELAGLVGTGEGADPAVAWSLAFAPPAPPASGPLASASPTSLPLASPPLVSTSPTSPPPASTSPASPRSPPPSAASSGGVLAWSIAGGVGVLALGTGAAAALVSADLNHSLDLAAARQAPLKDYGARNAWFIGLASTSAAAALTAVVVVAVNVGGV